MKQRRYEKLNRIRYTLSRGILLGVFAVCISYLSAGSAQAESSLTKHTGTKPSGALGSYYHTYSGGGETAWTCEEPVPGSPIFLPDANAKAQANLSYWAEEKNIIYGVGDYAGWKISPTDTEKLAEFIPRSQAFVSEHEGEGYHIYDAIRENTEIDLMGWKCTWRAGTCCHFYKDLLPGVENHTFCSLYRYKNKYGNTNRCSMAYFSGWVPLCADCGKAVTYFHHYLSKDSVSKISALDTSLNYIYQCPNCKGMEQGTEYIPHECKLVSPNRYRVVYNANASVYEGSIPDSFFTYKNLGEYEGEEIENLNSKLTKVIEGVYIDGKKQDTLRRQGYRFKGWNTKPDGSGVSIPDGYRIPDDPNQNLLGEVCKKQYIPGTNSIANGTITLYAQWEKYDVSLILDANGGRYNESGYSASVSGSKTTLKLSYGSTYSILNSKLTVPNGYRVSFRNSNAIYDTVHSDMYAERSFVGWSLTSGNTSTSILEKLSGSTWSYTGLGLKGSTATVTANYVDGKIILPQPNADKLTVGGRRFYGWSTTADGKNMVGQAGAEYYPTGNVTLYACYGALVLDAKANYNANSGKGAIDLSWKWDAAMLTSHVYAPYISDPNGSNSEAKRAYNNISGNNGLGSAEGVDLVRSGYQSGTYIIPTDGFYTFTLGGAAGGNYTNGAIRKTGGSGGEVTFGVYLKKGDRVEYVLGEKGGDNTVSGSFWTRCSAARGSGKGGDNGQNGAAGGGASQIKINGVVYAIAGGGGGASKDYNGGNGTGGINTHTGQTTADGQGGFSSLSSGGGGGYCGGDAGQNIIKYHEHSAGCGTHIHMAFNGAGGLQGINQKISSIGEANTSYDGYTGGEGTCFTQAVVGWDYVGDLWSQYKDCYDEGNDGKCDMSDQPMASCDHRNHYIAGLNPDTIRDKYRNWKLVDCGKCYFTAWGKYCISCPAGTHYNWRVDAINDKVGQYDYDENFFAGTIAVKWDTPPDYVSIENFAAWKTSKVAELYTKAVSRYEITCAYKDLDYTDNPNGYLCGKKTTTEESRIVTQSKGGSCYCRLDTAKESFGTATGYNGAGYLRIKSEAALQGSVDATTLSGLPANDTAAPRKLDLSKVSSELVGGAVEVTFYGTKDSGTVYRNRIKAYQKATGSFVVHSNETVTTITSGIGGYYYRFDTSPGTQIDSGSAITLSSRVTDDSAASHTVRIDAVNMSKLKQGTTVYCHLVAYDKAGNCIKGDTIHYKIKPDDEQVMEVKTEDMALSSKLTPSGKDYNNIKNLGAKRYVVRADGSPILLGFSAYTNRDTATTYQIDSMRFQMSCNDGKSQSVVVTLPYSTPVTSTAALSSGSFVKSVTGTSLLEDGRLVGANRTNNGNKTHISHAFYVPAGLHDKEVTVYPSASITAIAKRNGSSQDSDDRTHGITLIGDGKPPIIQGADTLESVLAQPIPLGQAIPILSVSAVDEGSAGMGSLEIAIQDLHSGETKRLHSDGSAIAVDLNEGRSHAGNLKITIMATDAVGNKAVKEIKYWAYYVLAFIERVLSPHEPVFKTGESGWLQIIASEKVDKVEVRFPVELCDKDPSLNQWVTFEKNAIEKRETLLFQIPLGTPEKDEYAVELYPYADGVLLSPNPIKCYFRVQGSVLEELRTRLR